MLAAELVPDEPILRIERNRRSVIVNHVQPNHAAVRVLALQLLDREVEHLGTQPHLAALVQHANRHYVASSPVADASTTA